jgi:ubiquinone/menaquinone biosynthesis C-methylase UbiE
MRQNKIWDEEYSKFEWRKETRTLPKMLQGKKVLELGVGNGKTLIAIHRQNPEEIYAVDFSEKAIEICKDKFQLDDIKFRVMDITLLDFPDDSFDAVVCYYVLNNLNENERRLAVKEIYRVLKDDGLVLFEDFSVGDFRFKKGSNLIAENTIVKASGLTCHFFTDKEIKELFNDFSKVKLEVRETKPLRGKDYTRKLISAVVRK